MGTLRARRGTPDLFTRHLRPSESVSYETNGDLISVAYGSFGLADMFTLFGVAGSVGGPMAAFLGISEEVMMEEVEFDAYF